VLLLDAAAAAGGWYSPEVATKPVSSSGAATRPMHCSQLGLDLLLEASALHCLSEQLVWRAWVGEQRCAERCARSRLLAHVNDPWQVRDSMALLPSGAWCARRRD
jgi:hypothetical protein